LVTEWNQKNAVGLDKNRICATMIQEPWAEINRVQELNQERGADINSLSNNQPGKWYTPQQSVRDKPGAQFVDQHSVG
jgi:hypothetical protein